MDKIKLRFEILKFKITLFTTILGAEVYLYINKKIFLNDFDKDLLYVIVLIIIFYGFFGFLTNLIKLNELNEEIKNEYL